MYQWTVFLHVLSAFILLLAHGATAAVMFKIKSHRTADQIRSLLGLRNIAQVPFFVSSTLMFLTGVALGFMGNWWNRIWIWAALILLIAISIFMGGFGRNYLDRVSQAVGLDPRGNPISTSAKQSELHEILVSGNPALLTWVGVGGFVIILWLMMFKPF